jgi:hypothetical protein
VNRQLFRFSLQTKICIGDPIAQESTLTRHPTVTQRLAKTSIGITVKVVKMCQAPAGLSLNGAREGARVAGWPGAARHGPALPRRIRLLRAGLELAIPARTGTGPASAFVPVSVCIRQICRTFSETFLAAALLISAALGPKSRRVCR